tara:strand:- start:997 stop:1647 length:651 start_codon:yes stop_codon:yes gene_type:complete
VHFQFKSEGKGKKKMEITESSPASFLAIDPASSTGWARADLDREGNVTLKEYGIIEVKNAALDKFSTVGETCNDLYESIEKLVDERTPEIVYVEDFFVSSRATRGVNLNLYLRGAIAMLLSRRKIKYKFLSPSEWKSYVTGSRSGKPTKSEKSALGKNANKTIITEKLAERYGITFPEKIHISGKLRKFKYDISDAVGILLCGIHSDNPHARFPSK